MNKEEKLNALLKPYLDENVTTEIPNEREMAIEDIKDTAKIYNAYDEIFEIFAKMQGSRFEDIDRKILEDIVPPPEIVDVDVDVYDEDAPYAKED